MAQSNSYPRDPVIKDKDVFSGTQFATLRTVNFTAQAVADYLNINGKISIGGQMTFKFVTLTPGNGTISFPLGGGDNTPFSAITNLVVSTTDMSTQNVVNFLDYIVGSEILLTEQSHISTFGNYRITGYAITANPNFYNLTLEYVGGFGNITQDLYYDLTFFRTEGSTPPVIPTKTSDLINDGEDGIHPFITAQDVPDALIFTSPLVDTAGTITINQSGLTTDGYLSSTDWNIFNGKENVLTFSPPLVRTIDAISIPKASSGINGYLSGPDWETFTNKQSALLGTGFVKSTAGVISYDTNTYYLASNPDGFITSAALTGYAPTSRTLTINGTAYNLTADRTWNVGTVTSVGLTMPVAFSVSNSPITGAGDIAVTAVGTSAQYIRGDGQLATFPTSGGGGSSVTYYLNGSIPSGVSGYQQMDNDAVIGLGTDFSLLGNGLIAQFLTDTGNPNRIEIPGGSWNFEMYFNISSAGGNTKFYIDLLKYNGTTFTLIASGSTNPEEITGGTSVDLYLTSLAVPTTPLLITDRLAIRVYIVDNSGGRTATLHTEDNNLCEIITTFSSGVASLNGLTASTQYFAVGTSGMDFNISSLVDTHTFNLPTASAVNRGALSSADWSTFNSKFNLPSLTSGSVLFSNGTTIAQDNANFFWDDTNNRLGIGTTTPAWKLDVAGTINSTDYRATDTLFLTADGDDTGSSPIVFRNGIYGEVARITSSGNVGIGTTTPNFPLQVNGNIAGAAFVSQPHNSTYDGNRLEYGTYGSVYGWKVYTDGVSVASFFNDRSLFTGNVGIGTTNPQKPLHVYGDIMLESSGGTETIWMSGGSAVRYSGGFLTLQNSISIDSNNGYVGIGIAIASTALDVNGVITATGGNSTSWNAKENSLTFSSPLTRTVDAISIPKASGGVNGYLSGPDWLIFNGKQDAITLTTTGTSGASTLIGNTLNIPQYSGGGGAVGRHALLPLKSGDVTNSVIVGGSLSSITFATGRLTAYPFIPNQSFTTSNLFINVTGPQVGSLSRIAIYSDLNGYPDSRLFVSADFDCSTAGIKTATTSFSFVAGTTYWLAFHSGNIASTTSTMTAAQSISIKAGVTASMANTVFYLLPLTTLTPDTFLAGQTFATANITYIGITKA